MRRLRRFPITPNDGRTGRDRKSTRLNSSHSQISYAVFCLKKKKKNFRSETEITLSNISNSHIAFAHLCSHKTNTNVQSDFCSRSFVSLHYMLPDATVV